MTTVPEAIVTYPAAGYTTGNVAHEISKAKDYNAREGRKRHVYYPMHSDYGAVGDGVTDDSAAINAAITAANLAGGGIVELPPVTFAVASSVNLKSNVTLRGTFGGAITWALGQRNGTNLLWTGAANGVVVNIFNCQNTRVTGVGVDGAAVSGVTGMFIDSNNSPASFHVKIDHFYIQRCGSGDGASTGNGYGIRLGQSLTSSYQMDKITILFGQIRGSYRGMSFESDNAAQGGLVDTVTFVNCYYGIEIQACGELAIKRCIDGGSNQVFIRFANRWNPVLIESCQSEGQFAVAGMCTILVASTAVPTTQRPITLIANSFNHADSAGYVIDIAQQCHVVSVGNQYGQNCRATVLGTVVEHFGDTIFTGGWIATNSAAVGGPGIKSRVVTAWTPGAIAAGATAILGVASGVYCAQGDTVVASFDQMQNNLDISASVTGLNAVNVFLSNRGGSSITPAAGNVTVATFATI